jgi:Fe-Mn family superoxide dismutase
MKLLGIDLRLLALVCAASMGPGAPGGAAGQTPEPAAAPFALDPLPYAENALEPHISARTLGFHYGKHHRGYVDNLNKLIAGTPLAGRSLEEIVAETAGKPDKTAVFNNAAQVWNHDFFWRSMRPGGGGAPAGALLAAIEKSFGSFDEFKKAFAAAGTGQFGSGWVWLVQDGGGLEIVATSNADTPAARGRNALLTCDVWEHAYYLDYQNRRKDFVEVFLEHLANWEFAASRMK